MSGNRYETPRALRDGSRTAGRYNARVTVEGPRTIGEGLAPPEPPIVIEHRQQLNNLADLLQAAGRQSESMRHLKRAVTLFAEIGVPRELEPEVWKLVEW